MFCGSMKFNLDPLHPLLTMMPEVIRAGDLAPARPGRAHAARRHGA